jgi:hypothetical protein
MIRLRSSLDPGGSMCRLRAVQAVMPAAAGRRARIATFGRDQECAHQHERGDSFASRSGSWCRASLPVSWRWCCSACLPGAALRCRRPTSRSGPRLQTVSPQALWRSTSRQGPWRRTSWSRRSPCDRTQRRSPRPRAGHWSAVSITPARTRTPSPSTTTWPARPSPPATRGRSRRRPELRAESRRSPASIRRAR